MKKEFDEQKKLIELKHKLRMKEIKYERDCRIEVEELKHQKFMEGQRVKTAEIKRSIDRRANLEFMKNYKNQ